MADPIQDPAAAEAAAIRSEFTTDENRLTSDAAKEASDVAALQSSLAALTSRVSALEAKSWSVAAPQAPIKDCSNASGVGLLLNGQPNTTWSDYQTLTGTSDSAVLLGPECVNVTFNRFHLENAASVGNGPGWGRHALYGKAPGITCQDWYVRGNANAPSIGSAFSLRYSGATIRRFDVDFLWVASFFDDDPNHVAGTGLLEYGKAGFHASAAMIVDAQFQWTIMCRYVDFTGPNSNVLTIDSGSKPPVVTFDHCTINGQPVAAANVVGATKPASLTIL